MGWIMECQDEDSIERHSRCKGVYGQLVTRSCKRKEIFISYLAFHIFAGNFILIKILPHLTGKSVLIWVFPHLAGNFVLIGFDLRASR